MANSLLRKQRTDAGSFERTSAGIRNAAQSGICVVPAKSRLDRRRGFTRTPPVWTYMETKDKTGEEELAFGELEALARALLAVFLSFMLASIASKQTELLELAPQFGIEFD